MKGISLTSIVMIVVFASIIATTVYFLPKDAEMNATTTSTTSTTSIATTTIIIPTTTLETTTIQETTTISPTTTTLETTTTIESIKKERETPTITNKTISRINLDCTGTSEHNCSDFWDIYSIDDFSAPESASCGEKITVTVKWTGWHGYYEECEPNYWGFFVETVEGDYLNVGTCNTFYSDDCDDEEVNYYEMSCEITMPDVGTIADGSYNLWVTGETYGGYCPPNEEVYSDYYNESILGPDNQSSRSITLNNCEEVSDSDGDGYTSDVDCDDTDSTVNPGATEICNEIDDNCDGSVDEGCGCIDGETMQCGTTDVGECEYGTQTCTAGSWGSCEGNIEPVLEICDGKDNDCDGSIDDDLTPSPCELTQSICAGSTKTCGGASGWISCKPSDYGPGYEEVEQSCDGLDNDCDGETDEGCEVECTSDEDCPSCQECLSTSTCSNVADGTDPKNDCGEGCQRCVSGTCQDYDVACSPPYPIYSDYLGICGWQRTDPECISDVCDDNTDNQEDCGPYVAYDDNTDCWTYGLEHCSQSCEAPCDEDVDCSEECSGKKWYSTYNCNDQCNCDLSNPICSVDHCGAECDGPEDCASGVCKSDCTCSETGGCPILRIYDGKKFVEVETLNIHSPKGIDTVYSRPVSMKPYDDGKYKIILTEASYLLWEGSHMDNVKLLANGKECELESAVHSRHGNVLNELIESDDIRTETKPGEEISLIFFDCTGDEFTFTVEGYNPIGGPRKLSLIFLNKLIEYISGLIGLKR